MLVHLFEKVFIMAQNTNENRSRTSSNFSWLCVCCVMLFLCLSIGTYIKERFEEKEFVKTSCYVRTSRVESYICRRIPDRICYFPIWEVEYSGNITENATIIENSNYRRNSYSITSALKEHFQVSRSIDVEGFCAEVFRLLLK